MNDSIGKILEDTHGIVTLTAVIHENHSFAIQCFYGDTFKAAKRMIWRKDNIVFIINKRYEV